MRNVLTLVLGGGQGTRLYPLTKYRSKPAVPFGSKYRLIDIPISNCINSGLNRIYVLTQFNSVSLHRHIRRTYNFDVYSGGFVEILAAQQTYECTNWYQGTADAVRHNLRYIQDRGVDYVLILSGDQLYRMDFTEMLATHVKAQADVTIAGLPVSRETATRCGIVRLDDSGRVVGFLEKPKSDEELVHVRTAPEWIDSRGVPSHGREFLASMGIYLFNRKTLVDVLEKTNYQDFGKEVFPASIRARRVQMHLFDGYWEDIGTVKSFHRANIEMGASDAPFNLISADSQIYTHPRFLAPSHIDGATVRRSLIADGCMIEDGAVIENSVIGVRCRIGRNVSIRNSIIMGADFYQTSKELAEDRARNEPFIGIGDGSRIVNAIIDKNCRIGRHVQIVNCDGAQTSPESPMGMIADGIVVIPKDTTVPDGTVI